MIRYIVLAIGIVLCTISIGIYFLYGKKAKCSSEDIATKYKKKRKKWLVFAIIGAYAAVTQAITLIFPNAQSKSLEVSIWAERVDLFGLSISTSVIYSWCIILVVALLALIIRLTALRKMKDQPKGIQNVLEICIEELNKYSNTQISDGAGQGLCAYLFALAVFMVGSAIVELFGLRSPTSDLTVTFALAIITFVLINFYGIRKKGVGGRIKSIASPTPVVFPMKVVSDLAVPVSLACRLFGNMLGGMVVMDLLYTSLKTYAVGIPSVLGLYFNVFHPLIQAFIFITLTLSFINEAVE